MMARMSETIDITLNTYVLRMFRNYATNGNRNNRLLLTTLDISREKVRLESSTYQCQDRRTFSTLKRHIKDIAVLKGTKPI